MCARTRDRRHHICLAVGFRLFSHLASSCANAGSVTGPRDMEQGQTAFEDMEEGQTAFEEEKEK